MASPDPSLLSLNTATISKQWTLAQAIEGCARHGIRGIAPWRDKLAEMGVRQAARAIKAHGLTVTGLCRGGFFIAQDWLDDNRRAIEEATELGDAATADLFTEITRGTDKLLWFVEAHGHASS